MRKPFQYTGHEMDDWLSELKEECVKNGTDPKAVESVLFFALLEMTKEKDPESYENIMKALSTDEVRGVGEWIPLNYSDEFYGDMYQCSNCGGATIGEPDYCECCGARMKGAEDGTADNS